MQARCGLFRLLCVQPNTSPAPRAAWFSPVALSVERHGFHQRCLLRVHVFPQRHKKKTKNNHRTKVRVCVCVSDREIWMTHNAQNEKGFSQLFFPAG